jgi:predicted metal-dependent hydrolase
MSTEAGFIQVSGIDVEVVRKDIKNLHLAVYPPDGRVRVATPIRLDDEAVRLAVASRLGWIRRQQDRLRRQVRQSQREMVNGESHYAWGRRYRLKVLEDSNMNRIAFGGGNTMTLHSRTGADRARREKTLNDWYRTELKSVIPELIAKWAPVVNVEIDDWGVKRMKTRWGSCNINARRIWLNLELAKKRPECLEYVVVHEMVHIIERLHDDQFKDLMDTLMPNWRSYRDELNRAPLAHEDWSY